MKASVMKILRLSAHQRVTLGIGLAKNWPTGQSANITSERPSMAYQTILFEVDDGVARLTLNRPERLNSFTAEMHGEVAAAMEQVEADPAIRVLLLTGAGLARTSPIERSRRAMHLLTSATRSSAIGRR
jgi:hypothetical protein